MCLIKLLRHFAACTNQKQSHLTYLLTLLKLYEPIPNYRLLPSTGKELMQIDGNDLPASRNEPLKKSCLKLLQLIMENTFTLVLKMP